MSIENFTPWTPDQPEVAVTITEPDRLDVDVYGAPYLKTPAELLPLTRDSFTALMDHLWGVIQKPFHVAITETDGTVTTGTIDLTRPQPDMPQGLAQSSPRRALLDDGQPTPAGPTPPAGLEAPPPPVAPAPELVAVSATGLWPGERVCLGLVVDQGKAGPDGKAGFQIPRYIVESLPGGGVLIFGQASHATLLDYPLR